VPQSKKILLVEDEGLIALAKANAIRRMGYEITIANSGESAIRLAREEATLGLTVMDIDLGRGVDGTEAARRILAERNLPIVFLTSHSEREMVEKVRGITRYGYIEKSLATSCCNHPLKWLLNSLNPPSLPRKRMRRYLRSSIGAGSFGKCSRLYLFQG
jgi:CheY-like chemotaxis protein